ncbi:MAG: hypothetical protein KDC84_11290 [Crocinitomicaceae bacterium]|nr:hypothetical protein [Crocinitomicaceae bacterium]
MDNVLDFIERHKYGITFAILLHLVIFVGLNFYKVSNPVEMPQRKVRVNVELDNYDVELTPEQMEAMMKNQQNGEDPKNMAANMNDDREKSYDDYSDYSANKNVEDYVKNYEKQMLADVQADREAKGEKYLADEYSDVKIYGGNEGNKNKNNANPSDKQYAGKTVLTYDLKDRGPKDNNSWYIRNPGYRCKGSGKVAVIIKVDRYGAVKEAKLDPAGSSSYSECMVENAIKYALLSKFNYKQSAPAMQTGRIFYSFIAQ